jgi:membrane-anchored protein YejM (alkaline phosphatase superfamily)
LATVMLQAEALIRDQSIHFVFIHLPVPHPPGIYNRKSGRLGAGASYIDNLAQADRALAKLIGVLNATALAPKTTVILCSDHSWRVPMWRSASPWTKEDEVASGGRFDPRPVLMIHFPGQQTEHDVTAPFEEIRIHGIIEHMLRGQEPAFDKQLLAGGGGLPVAAKP